MPTRDGKSSATGELAPSPAPIAPPASVEVETFEYSQYSGGAYCLLQKCANGRSFPVWVREEELAMVVYEPKSGSLPSGYRLTGQLPALEALSERTCSLLIHSRSEDDFQCCALLRDPVEEIELTGGIVEAMILALYTEAPMYVTERVLEDLPQQQLLPKGWVVIADFSPAGEIQIATTRYTKEEFRGVLLFLVIVLAITVCAGYHQVPVLFFLGGITLLRLVEPFLWWMFGRETWRLAPNALEFRRSFLGFSWGRRVVGGSLVVTRARTPRGDWNGLLVEERGRRRLLTPNVSTEYALALGEFVSAYTGWPLLRED